MAQLVACRDSVPGSYNFWLYLPDDYCVTDEKPVLIFLHGRSLSGNNLASVRRYGCLDAIVKGRKIDAIVLAPQTSNGWNPEKVMELYDWTKKHYAVDTNRLYVLGMSMGGYGTLDFAATYSDKIAAGIALCGGSTKKDLCGLNEFPLWIIHGTADEAIPVQQSQKVVDAMIQCGDTSLLRFDKMKGANHGVLARVFYLRDIYDWLFEHSRADSVQTFGTRYKMDKECLKNAYSDFDKKPNLIVRDSKNEVDTCKSNGGPVYIVKKGDTLESIAKKNHTTVAKLCKQNQIKKSSVLRIGQKIKLN